MEVVVTVVVSGSRTLLMFWTEIGGVFTDSIAIGR